MVERMHMEWEIQNAEIVTTNGTIHNNIYIKNGLFHSIQKEISNSDSPLLDAKGLYLYPALINAHDHMIATYAPKVGGNPKYQNWLSWDNELKSSLVFSERQTLEIIDLYMLGAFRNMFGATTTVMDHIPHFVNNPFKEKLPIRLLADYQLSHSIGNYNLGWGDGSALEYQLAEKKKIPFVTHLGEGYDEESVQSLKTLEKMGALGKYSVLVHCLPFGFKEAQRIADAGAHLVWCPSSNLHIFGRTTNIASFLKANVNISLGTDLAMAGASNLLEEMKIAKAILDENGFTDNSAKALFAMTTSNSAQALQISSKLGSVEVGKIADFFLLEKKFNDPYENLLQAKPEDILFLAKDGLPILGDSKLDSLWKDLKVDSELIRVQALQPVERRIVGSPKKTLKRIQTLLGYKKDLAFLPILESIV
jgi:5-methylthioadenosine/S-adenosylhomocysteine deaminase